VFDIHGGGIDLVFPHHENENAQSCCANNTQNMANFWLHNGHLMVNGSKMSKSLGNFFTVRDLLENAPGEAIRLALLNTHYRQPLDFTNDALLAAKATLDRFYKAIAFANNDTDIDSQVLEALNDDLNTPLAIARLHELSSSIFKASGAQQQQLANTLKTSAQILGLLYQTSEQWFQQGTNNSFTPEQIEHLILQRAQAKQAKDFSKADSIRKQLLENGVILEDSSQGTTWRMA
jgi:cysteinyl-tRNA synthetase